MSESSDVIKLSILVKTLSILDELTIDEINDVDVSVTDYGDETRLSLSVDIKKYPTADKNS